MALPSLRRNKFNKGRMWRKKETILDMVKGIYRHFQGMQRLVAMPHLCK